MVRPGSTYDHSNGERRLQLTLIWFIVWLIANNVGGHEPLVFDPVNAWVATLILAAALDLGASHARTAR